MILPDVNVLVYAHRRDTPDHQAYRSWLESVLDSDSAYAMSELVLSGFLRVVTHPRVFKQPSSLRDAMTFANQLRDQTNCVSIVPGRAHWRIFSRLCSDVNAKGNLVPDAYYAALAIEHGCEWITTDRDFSRFSGLKWRHPMS